MKYLNALVVLLCCFPSFLIHGQIANKQPNILLIYTDDHRYSGIRALMQQEVETPNLDQLIAEGVSFDKTYLMGLLREPLVPLVGYAFNRQTSI